MSSLPRPLLYSFRRCPYAMRGRMGLFVSGMTCELREVVLRDKPPSMLALSPKGTVPVLQTVEGTVIDESLEVMLWALEQYDPEGWLQPEQGNLDDMLALIERNDGEFKEHLDRYKYPTRYDSVDPLAERSKAEGFLQELEKRLSASSFLFGSRVSLADYAIAPFVRQFAHVDKDWFDQTPYPGLQAWLEVFLKSDLFISVMKKYPQWHEGDEPVMFG
ncbi:MAG: glutathione S-transferase [Rhodospirillales bacterium]|nr:glutathione S-transferase [Rhodospirillales bacterium]